MAQEIERKFLLKSEAWRKLATGKPYRQGYLSNEKDLTVRVRIAGDLGFLTIKGPTKGLARTELEYPIPVDDAGALLEMCKGPLIEKTRYAIRIGEYTWEVDEFHGDNAGLVVAEVELAREDEKPPLPDWIGQEVSDDGRYFNANLVRHPFKDW